MAKTSHSTVLVKGNPIFKEYPLDSFDIYGNGAVRPGMLVDVSDGKCSPQYDDTNYTPPTFAHEGLAIDADSKTMGDILTEYDTVGQAVRVGYHQPGDEIVALLAAGQDVSMGAFLVSNGDGGLKAGSSNIVCRALEAVDNNPGTDFKTILVEVM
jgi:hypothetical protein